MASPRTEKAIVVDLYGSPGLGFCRRKTKKSSESLENLHVSLKYVYKCDVRLVVAYIGPAHDTVHIHGLTIGKLHWSTIGVDLRVPLSRVSPDTDHRSVGIPGKLACVPNIYIEV